MKLNSCRPDFGGNFLEFGCSAQRRKYRVERCMRGDIVWGQRSRYLSPEVVLGRRGGLSYKNTIYEVIIPHDYTFNGTSGAALF